MPRIDVVVREKVVPLRLRHVTDAAKPRVVRKRLERLVESRRPQIHPTDDALDEWDAVQRGRAETASR